MSSIKPLTPDQVVERKAEDMPDFVLETFNSLIAAKWNGHSSTFTQNEAIEKLQSTTTSIQITRKDIIEKGWLDIEDIYRATGWHVVYDKPDYTESFEPYFTFKKN